VPNGEVEVEYCNKDGDATVPSDLMITKTILAGENDVFACATPAGGWWGVAALKTASETLLYKGVEKPV
jgi:cobalt/nickel transport protein